MKIHARTPLAIVALATATALGLSACGGSSSGSNGGSTNLSVVAFSVPKAANNAAEQAFARTDAGKGVIFKESYGASGDQSRSVASGLKADYVNFSLSPDVARLVEAGLVAKDWNTGPTKGIVGRSIVVIVVRKGNPKNIKDWDDLTKPGVKIVTPNPGSSGSARWNILAGYGHTLVNGGTEADAKKYLTDLFTHVAALPGSGREASTAFEGGTGDALLSYENEAILARQSGQDFDYVIPSTSLLIENPGAVTKKADPKAKKFLDFVESKKGQAYYVAKGFRPVVDGVETSNVKGANDPANPFPAPSKKLLTIDADFGGWDAASKKFFDEKTGIVTKIQETTNKS